MGFEVFLTFMTSSLVGTVTQMVEVRAGKWLQLLSPLQQACLLTWELQVAGLSCLPGWPDQAPFNHCCLALSWGVPGLSWGLCFCRAISWYLAWEEFTSAAFFFFFFFSTLRSLSESLECRNGNTVCMPCTTLPQGLSGCRYVQGQLERSLPTCISICRIVSQLLICIYRET